ncbi:MAG: nucleotidyltransferase family protein [Sedimentisphaerales bacterium]|nr:nucleotidyltransferase family protein [Sedimentisphaerales bacterium]
MICAIVLAAGQSQRMGVQKLLLPFGSKTVITHIVDQLTASSVDGVHVVVGCHGERVSRELSDRPVSIVNNSHYKSGMLSSVRCGINAITQQSKAILVALGDQPSLTSKLIDQMLQTFASTEKHILVPLYKGKRGHPIIFSAAYREEILTHYDNVGLRGLLYDHKDDIFELPVATSGVLSDMDYPEDYQREIALLKEKNEEDAPFEEQVK